MTTKGAVTREHVRSHFKTKLRDDSYGMHCLSRKSEEDSKIAKKNSRQGKVRQEENSRLALGIQQNAVNGHRFAREVQAVSYPNYSAFGSVPRMKSYSSPQCHHVLQDLDIDSAYFASHSVSRHKLGTSVSRDSLRLQLSSKASA